MHQRRIIREAVVDHLTDKVEAFGDRIFKSRETPANVSGLLKEGPICNIYTRKDHIKPDNYPKSGFDGAVKRTLDLAIEITAAGTWTVDEKLDDLADAVESLLENFEVPGLPATEFRLASTEIDSTDEFDVALGGALLIYEVDYWRAYRTDTSEEVAPCGGDLFTIVNGRPAEALPGCGC